MTDRFLKINNGEARMTDATGGGGGAASDVTYVNTTSGLAAVNVQTAIDEVDGDLDNIITLSGVARDAVNLGAFTGVTISDNRTIKQALQDLETSLEEIDTNVNDLITLSGVAENAQHLGTFTGTTIADNSTIKAALQALETEVETKADAGGSAASGINYITNYIFETDDAGWVEYADAAGVVPVDGTGGSPVTVFSRSTSAPLRGTASGLWSKTGSANRQGEGVAYAFTLDTADQGKMQSISFDYTVGSSYVDGDMRIYIYDVTNSVLIEPSQRDILANSGQARYLGYFQAPSNSTSYRLIIHTATTSALNYDLKIDNVRVGPIESGNAGTFVSDWQSFTPTGSFTTNTTYSGKYRRNGDSIDMDVYITFTGIPNSVSCSVNAPSGITLDLAKFASGSNTLQPVGDATFRDASTETYSGFVYLEGATSFTIRKDDGDGTSSAVTQAAPFAFNSTDYISLCIRGVPVVGWSTGVSASEISSNSPIAFRSSLTSSTQSISSASETKLLLNTVDPSGGRDLYDTAGGFDASNNRYVIPESGIYFLKFDAQFDDITAGTALIVTIKKNGTAFRKAFITSHTTYPFPYMSVITKCNKGDYIEVFATCSDGSYTLYGSDTTQGTYLEGFKINNPAQIAPTEFVGCSYETDAGQSLTSGAITQVIFEDKILDSHGMMNTGTGTVTIPISGKYLITFQYLMAPSTAWEVTEAGAGYIYKNGTQVCASYYSLPASTASSLYISSGSIQYLNSFVKGDTVDCRIYQDSDSTRTLQAGGVFNRISVTKVG